MPDSDNDAVEEAVAPDAIMETEGTEKKRLVAPNAAERLVNELRFIVDINHPEDVITSEELGEILEKYEDVFDV